LTARTSANWICLFLFAGACLAQDPAALFEKAPPDIEEALRARITKFYQAHVEGKFRAADELVAEDSKDDFFAAEKARCRAFAIMKITYWDNFSHARVAVACDTQMLMPPVGLIAVKRPLSSLWKVVGGQWFWYIGSAAEQEIVTPFGIRKPVPPGQPEAGPPRPPGAPVDLETISKLVKVDKPEVRFDPQAPGTDHVVVTNQMPGSVTLSLEPGSLPGLDLKLDRTSLKQGESAVLSIRYEPSQERKPASAVVRIAVSPTEQVIPVRIQFGLAR
jgi:hypothetical protein